MSVIPEGVVEKKHRPATPSLAAVTLANVDTDRQRCPVLGHLNCSLSVSAEVDHSASGDGGPDVGSQQHLGLGAAAVGSTVAADAFAGLGQATKKSIANTTT